MNDSNLFGYPRLRLSAGMAPGLTATRLVKDDGAEYFGPFLPDTGARLIFGFAVKNFGVRTCDIQVDGDAAYPCPAYYRKTCAAPCVRALCGPGEYEVRIGMLRLFLSNRRRKLRAALKAKMADAAGKLAFEDAARWRDLLTNLEKLWKSKRWQSWLDDVADSWEIVAGDSSLSLYVVTQRGRRVLGGRVFDIGAGAGDAEEAHGRVGEIVFGFYRNYLPREIRFLFRFGKAEELRSHIRRIHGESIPVKDEFGSRPTTVRGFERIRRERAMDALGRDDKRAPGALRKAFGLSRSPRKIEAIDASHTSGKNVVVALTVWENGDFNLEGDRVWHFAESSESEAVATALKDRFADGAGKPDLILVDGGKSQLSPVIETLPKGSEITVIAAAKKPGKPRSIAYFLNRELGRVEVDDLPAVAFLSLLRDAAHDLANQTHRLFRDTSQFYELAATLPSFGERERRSILKAAGSLYRLRHAGPEKLQRLFGDETAAKILADMAIREERNGADMFKRLVPVRYDYPGGGAGDLRPILRYRL